MKKSDKVEKKSQFYFCVISNLFLFGFVLKFLFFCFIAIQDGITVDLAIEVLSQAISESLESLGETGVPSQGVSSQGVPSQRVPSQGVPSQGSSTGSLCSVQSGSGLYVFEFEIIFLKLKCF